MTMLAKRRSPDKCLARRVSSGHLSQLPSFCTWSREQTLAVAPTGPTLPLRTLGWNSSAVIPRLLGYVESIARRRQKNGISPTIMERVQWDRGKPWDDAYLTFDYKPLRDLLCVALGHSAPNRFPTASGRGGRGEQPMMPFEHLGMPQNVPFIVAPNARGRLPESRSLSNLGCIKFASRPCGLGGWIPSKHVKQPSA